MNKIFPLFFFILFSFQLQADPWGKDACLVNPACPPVIHIPRNPVEALAVSLIRFHKTVVSPADGPRSNFIPNSSQYTLDAIYKYGFVGGFLLGCDRLMRENDSRWVYGKAQGEFGIVKFDPVK